MAHRGRRLSGQLRASARVRTRRRESRGEAFRSLALGLAPGIRRPGRRSGVNSCRGLASYYATALIRSLIARCSSDGARCATVVGADRAWRLAPRGVERPEPAAGQPNDAFWTWTW